MENKKSIFRQESLDRIKSPEQIDEYIQVSSISGWVLIAALSILVIGVLIWGFVGSIPESVLVKGAYRVIDGKEMIITLLPIDSVDGELMDCTVNITRSNGEKIIGRVAKVGQDPVTYDEADDVVSSAWRMNVLWGDSDVVYKYIVLVEIPQEDAAKMHDREILDVAVIIKEVKPIVYVLN